MAALTLATPDEARLLHERCGFAESVYLATCNRVHVMFVGKPGVSIASYRRRVHAFFAERAHAEPFPIHEARGLTAYAGEGALEHLFVVAAALDSMVPGEAQILGQVKAAFRAADEAGLAGEELQKIYADAFAIAKEVREHTALGRGRTSMFSLATQLMDQHVASATSQRRAHVALVGVGEMSEQCARWARERGDIELVVVNRTLPRAQQLAQRVGARAMDLQSFLATPGRHDVLVCATSSATPLFFAHTLRQLGPNTLLIDLAIPRDIDLDGAAQAQLPLWDIDRLQTRARAHAAARHTEVGEARLRIDEALERFRLRQLSRNVGATIEAWRHHSQSVLERELSAILRTRGRQTTGEERERLSEALEQFGRRLLGQWLHGPTLGLKEIGRHFGNEAVDAFAQVAIAPPQARRTRAR